MGIQSWTINSDILIFYFHIMIYSTHVQILSNSKVHWGPNPELNIFL